MGGFRRWGKMEGFFEEPPHLRRTLHIFDLRSRRSKNPPHLQSSIFGPEDRRTPPHLRSSDPKDGSKIGRKTGEGVRLLRRWGGFFEDGGGSSICRVRGTRSPPIFHFLGPKNEEPFHILLLPTPPSTNGHQLISATLRSGSSNRSSTVKKAPKIEVGSPLSEIWMCSPRSGCLA